MLADGRAVLLQFCGEVDVATAPVLERGLAELCTVADGTGARLAVVDLGAVTFFGSAGLVELLSAHQRAVGLRLRLVVVAPPGHVVRKLLTTTQVDLALPVVDTVQRALEPRPEPPA